MSQKYIGLDVGGTTVKIAILDEEFKIINKWEVETRIEDNGRYIVADIVKSLQKELTVLGINKSEIKGIGAGVPGFINPKTQVVDIAVNLGWKNYDFKQDLENLFGLPVILENDANLAALGELANGAGKGEENVLCVTLGTGVGGGVIINGEIVHGENGMAGEIGHITSEPFSHVRCNCGKSGCLETVASATGILRMATEQAGDFPGFVPSSLQSILKNKGKLATKDVFEEAKKGDAISLGIVDIAMSHLGIALGNICATVNPSVIIVGGGVSKAGSFLIQKLEERFKQFAIPKIGQETKIKLADLGNDAGVYGGAWLVKNKIN